MKPGLRVGIAAFAAALALIPARAQETPSNDAAPATIGPRELQDFSINGTVTREAPAEPAPRPAPPAERPAPAAPASPSVQPPAGGSGTARAPVTIVTPQREPAQSVTIDLPDVPEPTADGGSTASVEPAPTLSPEPAISSQSIPPSANLPSEQASWSLFPWLAALLGLAAVLAYLAWRQRARRAALANAGALETFVPAQPAPQSSPLRPTGTAPDHGAIVTRLRPRIEIEFTPTRCVVDEDKATIQFDLSLFNAGSAPARDVLVEACMFNAGPTQDQQIGGFFEKPVGQGNRVQILPPLKRLSLTSEVTLTREQMNVFEVAGRRLFVPLLAFNALYRWSGGEGQTSASYLVGRETKTEKLAPFRLDLGPRMFRGLGARKHNLSVQQ